jgi:hypothetical protein
LVRATPEGKGEVVVMLRPDAEEEPLACLRVATNRVLDQEIVHRIERVAGVTHVALNLAGGVSRAS